MDVERLLVNIPVTINFVERHSPIVRDFHNWLNRNRAQVDRMDFQWGKYRYRDNRPTMGIMSEISHPLDLVRCLAGVPASTNLSLVSANILQSNFTCMQPYVPDSINVAYTLDNIVVTGVSSFLWPTRRRQITALISNRGGARSYQAVLNFDDKHWDEDRLAIYRLDPVSGERNLEYHSEYTNDDFPEALFQTNKVARFVAESMSLLGDEPSALVAQLSDARWAQQAMHTVTQDALLLPALRFPEGKTDQQTSTK